ncbi:hypothetical protein ACF3M2_17435 [Tissierella carlieri]
MIAAKKILKEIEGIDTEKSKERYLILEKTIKEYEEVLRKIEG